MQDARRPSSSSPTRLERREFLKRCAAGGALLVTPRLQDRVRPAAEPHAIPAQKDIPAAWTADLLAPGGERAYRGEHQAAVAMPVCGIGTGQLYLLPDGTLETWDLFNEHRFSGYGRDNYGRGVAKGGVAQGFGLVIDGRLRPLSKLGFARTDFHADYPIGRVRYVDEGCPLEATLEAFSPFIPLDAPDSGLPATVFRLHLKNSTAAPISTQLVAWLENAGCQRAARGFAGQKTAALLRDANGRALLSLAAAAPAVPPRDKPRPRILLADFEGDDWRGWRVEGEAFGPAPTAGTLPRQQPVTGFAGKKLANSYARGDDAKGTLTSPAFAIERDFVNVLVGGGSFPAETCVELLVSDTLGEHVVRSAQGESSEQLRWHAWDVRDLFGRQARIRIADRRAGGWGHVLADEVELADVPRGEASLAAQPDFAELALVLPQPPSTWAFDLPRDPREPRSIDAAAVEAEGFTAKLRSETSSAGLPLGARPIAGATIPVDLGPGDETSLVFVLAWFAPNHPFGRAYATRFHSALEVADYVAGELPRLERDTRAFVAAYHDSTLPRWLLDRCLFPIANLATSLVQWRKSGRFWAWEGVGCCEGTCTHVWNYAQGMAALFPELERSAREHQDFGAGFDEATGLVGFRGNRRYAADGQCGTVLKAYREHLHSADDSFLRRCWPRIRMALELLLQHDANGDGLIEDEQHNTYDIEFFGANTFVGALYLAALRAGAAMAERVGDATFERALLLVAEEGGKRTMERLWNGDYFVQDVDLKQHPDWQYADGCLSDQLFGQNWAHQLGLGYLYPPDAVRKALQSVYRYNWAVDVGVYRQPGEPERAFAWPGEPGLVTCTWPRSRFMPKGVRYRSEVWTGIEHQVASHMLYEGLVTEALHVLRGIEARYDGRRNNPFNEVECGDHYARALAAWGCLTGIMGFTLDGPAGVYRFDPRLTPERFKAFFAGPEGWGSYEQARSAAGQVCTLSLRHGRLRLREFVLRGPGEPIEVTGTGGAAWQHKTTADGRTHILFSRDVLLEVGTPLRATLR